jgi:serine/threonine-protein kinase Chk2
VNDEAEEGVWGYLLPLDPKYGKSLVLKKRNACPLPGGMQDFGKASGNRMSKNGKGKDYEKEEEAYEQTKLQGIASGGYLIGRHPECGKCFGPSSGHTLANLDIADLIIDDPIVSNRHCLLFTENKGGDTIAVVEDLSSNGTFVNEALIGRNKRRELQDQDEITVMDKARFVFRYPKNRETSAFLQQYTLLEKLGKGHFAEVFLCIEKASGQRYAVKIFTKQPGVEERSKTEGLQQEIAVLMGVSHPNMLCLKDTFDEPNAVYLVLELAAEGELFNWIVMKQKLTEEETRKVFVQLFQGVKYLVSPKLRPLTHLLTCNSMSGGSFTEISSQRTFCSRTKISMLSWPILAWPRSLARNPSPPHCVGRPATSPLKSSKILDTVGIPVQSTFGH